MTLAARVMFRRAGLLALGALLAAAALALGAPPAGAEDPPPDFALRLSLAEDSDNIVPTNSVVKVAANFDWIGRGQGLPQVSDIQLRVSGAQEWENNGRRSISLVDQFPGTRAWVGSLAGNDDRFGAGRLDGRTLVVGSARHDGCAPSQPGCYFSTGDVGIAYLYDFKTRREITQIRPEVFLGYQQKYFGESKSIAVWEDDSRGEDKEVAYIFLGGREWYPQGEKSTKQWTGRLFIFKIDWGADEPELQLINQLGPPNPGIGAQSRFGQSVEISRDGSTLVVSAPIMEEKGAVFVFDKPNDGWENLAFSDAARLDVVPGHPRTGTDLDKSYLGAQFGKAVAISANGDTIVTGAFVKDKTDANANMDVYSKPSGVVIGQTAGRYSVLGEAQIFVRPSGGWADDSTPDRIFRAEQAQDVSWHSFQSFAEFVDISPDGETVAMSASGWAVPGLKRLGSGANTESTTTGYVYVWVKPATGWGASISSPSYNQTRTSPSATIPVDIRPTATISPATGGTGAHGTIGGEFSYGGLSFNKDGTRLVISDTKYHDAAMIADRNYYGRAWIFEKPEAGWADVDTRHESATLLESPRRRWSGFFGEVTYDLDGEILLSYADQRSSTYGRTGMGPGRLWTFDEELDLIAGAGGCTRGQGEGDTTWSCPLNLEFERPVPASMETFDPVGTPINLVVPIGTPNGTKFTISANVTVEGERYRDTLEVQVGKVDEVADATLDFAVDASTGQPHKDTVVVGDSTTLLLRVLNENGGASAVGSIAQVLFTTTRGNLSARLGDATAEACLTSGIITCQIKDAATALTAGNADKIRLTVSHPGAGRGGQATVRVTVIATDGGSFSPEPVQIIFAGAANALAISEPSRTLLSFDTCDTPDADDGPEDCRATADRDDRDVLTLQITATDREGNPATVPTTAYGTPTIRGPDGKRVDSSRIAVTWPLRKDGDDVGSDVTDSDPLDTKNGAPQARLNVNAAAAAKLANGEYTLELSAGSLKAKQTFRVSGAPHMVALTTPEGVPMINSQVTVSAQITDAEGAAVPDGTMVRWEDNPTGTAPVLIELRSGSTTMDGQATATYLVIGRGTAYVRATAGEATNIRLLSVGAMEQMDVSDSLSSTEPAGYSTWLSESRARASVVLASVDGVNSMLLWQAGVWLRYGVTDSGREIPGSMDFVVRQGAVLWLGE